MNCKLLLKACSLFFFFLCLCFHTSIAQSGLPNTVQKIFPPSPEASALGKYVDIPISLYTGTPQIGVPIFTVTEGAISVPIGLSYQTGGFKADELATRTGLGWVLNAGGVITRSIRGYADEYEGGFLTLGPQVEHFDVGTPAELYQRYDYVARGCGDAEPDEFFMNFNGITAKFAFNTNGTIAYSSTRKLKITPLGFTAGLRNYIKSWEVITEDGMKYQFDSTEYTKVLNFEEWFACSHRQEQANTWHLTKITAPNGEFVKFAYSPYTLTHRILSSEAIQHFNGIEPGQRVVSIIRNQVKGFVLSQITTSSGQITVDFRAIKTRTDVEPPDPSFTDNVTSNYNSLDTIIIRNKSNAIVVKHALEYDYSSARLMLKSITEIGSDGVTMKPPTQFQYKPGSFPLGVVNYAKDHWGFLNSNTKTTLIPPYYYAKGSLYADGADRSADGTKSQYGLLTKIIYPTGGSQTFEYEPHDYTVREERKLPPKVVSVGTEGGPYDPDEVISAPFYVGPLAKGTSFDISYATYRYAVGGDARPKVQLLRANGTVLCIDNPYPFPDPCMEWKVWDAGVYHLNPEELPAGAFPPGMYMIRAFAKGVGVDEEGRNRGDIADISVTWTEVATDSVDVTKYVGGARIKTITSEAFFGDPNKMVKRFEYKRDNGTSSGELVTPIDDDSYTSWTGVNTSNDPNTVQTMDVLTRLSASRSMLGSTQGSHIGYKQVTVYNGINGENGKSVSKFMSPNDYPDDVNTDFPYPPGFSMDYHRGLLEEETHYKNENGSYTPVNKSQYTYHFLEMPIAAAKVGVLVTGPGPFGESFLFRYGKGIYRMNLGLTQVKTVKTDLIVNGKAFSNESSTEYDDSLHFLKKEIKTVSANKKLVTEYFYLQDFQSPSTAMLEMKNLHRFPLIEQISSQMGSDGIKRTIGGSFTEYKKITNLLLPEKYYKMIAAVPINNFGGTINRSGSTVDPNIYKEISRNVAYDSSGNILQAKPKEKENQVFIWGYDKTLPIAKVDNATFADVAYCDFEDSASGGFSFSMASTNYSTDAMTGKRSYKGPTITRSIANKSFKVSCWAKAAANSSVILNGISKPVGTVWTFCEWDVAAGNSTVSITTNGCNIDGLRLHPAGSLMETYTYEPLVGISSSCSVNNMVTYYEYDALRRLSIVRDQKKNIVKTYRYNYHN